MKRTALPRGSSVGLVRGALAALAGALLTTAGGAGGTALATPAPSPPDTTTRTIIFVRHAEKNPHPVGGDAGLNTRGLVRAQTLAHVLADAGIQIVYTSQFGRNRQTAEPIAKAIGDSARVYDANDLPGLADRLRATPPGGTVLVVGHTDTIPQTIEELIGRRPPEGEPVDYDRMYVLMLNADGTYRLLHLQYGAP
ncbi:MAG: SixA phosphatase family protein [Candidatus Eiseniibacteriota bacterium]